METTDKIKITVEVTVKASVDKVWDLWTSPAHITKWNQASDDWHTPSAQNDLHPRGKFLYRMEARDGSSGINFWGVYDEIKKNHLIAYTTGDGRKVKITFTRIGAETKVVEIFEAESTNPPEMQRQGWQAILESFKKHAEANS